MGWHTSWGYQIRTWSAFAPNSADEVGRRHSASGEEERVSCRRFRPATTKADYYSVPLPFARLGATRGGSSGCFG